jgi:dephospho-CoA kinase
LAEVAACFGAGVLDDNGRLDRSAMRRRVFADTSARRQLEAIIHPRVRQALAAAVAGWTAPYGLLAIPLLAENAAAYAWVDRVLVVDVPEATQVERLVARDGIDPALARQILAAQATRAQRLAIADEVHDATGPLAALDDRAANLHRHYLELAQAKTGGTLAPPRIRGRTETGRGPD